MHQQFRGLGRRDKGAPSARERNHHSGRRTAKVNYVPEARTSRERRRGRPGQLPAALIGRPGRACPRLYFANGICRVGRRAALVGIRRGAGR